MIEKDVWEDGWLTGSNTSILQRRWTASCVAWLDSVYRTGRDGCRQKQTAHCQSSSSYLQTAIYVCSLNNWSAALWDVALQQLWPRSEREVERTQQAFGQSSARIKLANQREFLSFLFFKGLLTWNICATGYSLSKALANQCEGVLRKDTQLTQSDCISSENSKRYKHKVHHSFRGMKQMYDTAVLWNPNQSVLSLFLNLFKWKNHFVLWKYEEWIVWWLFEKDVFALTKLTDKACRYHATRSCFPAERLFCLYASNLPIYEETHNIKIRTLTFNVCRVVSIDTDTNLSIFYIFSASTLGYIRPTEHYTQNHNEHKRLFFLL